MSQVASPSGARDSTRSPCGETGRPGRGRGTARHEDRARRVDEAPRPQPSGRRHADADPAPQRGGRARLRGAARRACLLARGGAPGQTARRRLHGQSSPRPAGDHAGGDHRRPRPRPARRPGEVPAGSRRRASRPRRRRRLARSGRRGGHLPGPRCTAGSTQRERRARGGAQPRPRPDRIGARRLRRQRLRPAGGLDVSARRPLR